MATLVQELTDDGAYDLDADPAVEGANEATWLEGLIFVMMTISLMLLV